MKFADLPPSPVGPERTYQSLVEFGSLWTMCAAIEPTVVVEIGSLYGGTLWYWLQLPTVEHVISVDLITEWDPIRADVELAREAWWGWTSEGKHLTVAERDSHDPETVDLIVCSTAFRWIDVLFLDGDHLYEGVKADFDLWSPHVAPGGIVAFHDTVPNGTRFEPGVVEFVNELKWRPGWLSLEIFEQDGAGITAFVKPWKEHA